MYLGAPIKAKTNSTNENGEEIKPKKINEYKLPKDIGPGLLKFCLTHSDSPNLKETVLPEDRDPKDYDWLRQAFDNLEDDAKKMKKLLEIFDETKPENQSLSVEERENKYITSLETLQFYIEDIDNAGDFIKIGGIPVLIKLLTPLSGSGSGGDKVRADAATCLSTITQSEETIQAYLHSLGVLDLAVKQLQKEINPLVREKFLSLISSLLSYEIRKCTFDKSILNTIVELSTTFLSPTVELTVQLNNDDSSTHTISIDNGVSGISKACFLLNKIFIASPDTKEFAIKCGTLDGLIGLIKAFNKIQQQSTTTTTTALLDTQIVMVEKAEITLLQLIDKNNSAIEQCKQQQLSLEIEKRLTFTTKNLNPKDYEDEIQTLNNIKSLLK
ncbi:hypothetical protein DDB_G0284643 [Dictyostelium discoideum AX4]|uniref:Nucleotide exchange factor Fes1 domain-containing protein n=1 Tax=Dictyostelium discoideum TaxID=44689 RepID=Q54PC6_DICDI|nr:hypothetical protein DDB_G0284643 [Dictyostelium discoideum AX4]EAL65091.1 hypothetical protein DDB_G0284643 [Dictyostelium discoideum AX4]|eukprot:XP_638449.1 hypothetical protein DDB_G0284643 [Dictyostelium discoideum AX4]